MTMPTHVPRRTLRDITKRETREKSLEKGERVGMVRVSSADSTVRLFGQTLPRPLVALADRDGFIAISGGSARGWFDNARPASSTFDGQQIFTSRNISVASGRHDGVGVPQTLDGYKLIANILIEEAATEDRS